mgnify:CR=1 FL=1
MAATILIAQYRGAGNKEKVTEVCTVALLTNFIFGLIISSILFCFDNFFLDLLAVPDDIRSEAGLFLRYIGFVYSGPGSIHLISFFRGYFTAKSTMMTSIIMNVINIICNVFLIHASAPSPLGSIGSDYFNQQQ